MGECGDRTFESRGLEMCLRRKHPVSSLWIAFQRKMHSLERRMVVNEDDDDDGEAEPKRKKGKLISFETIPKFSHCECVCAFHKFGERKGQWKT